MSEQGLRDALQRLADQDGPIDPSEIRDLLFDRPSEPTVVTDEAVEAAARVTAGEFKLKLEALSEPTREIWRSSSRAALEAAAPLLGPRPQVGVVHVQHADSEEYARIFNLGFAEAVEQYAADAPRPLLDREAVCQAIAGNVWASELDQEEVDGIADAVMELARPMPTREQIVTAIGDALWFEEHPERTGAQINNVATDAVLALLNGAGS